MRTNKITGYYGVLFPSNEQEDYVIAKLPDSKYSSVISTLISCCGHYIGGQGIRYRELIKLIPYKELVKQSKLDIVDAMFDYMTNQLTVTLQERDGDGLKISHVDAKFCIFKNKSHVTECFTPEHNIYDDSYTE